MSKYEFKTEPLAHQFQTLKDSWSKEFWAWFLQMGLGKSKICLDNAGILFERGHINCLVVFAPKGVYLNWIDEIEKHLPDRIKRRIWYYDAYKHKTRSWQRKLDVALEDETVLTIILFNVEAFQLGKEAQKVLARVVTKRVCMGVIDESTVIANAAAARTQALLRFRSHFKFRRIMTGMPVKKHHQDVWSQTEFLKHGALGFTKKAAFDRRYTLYHEERDGSNRIVRRFIIGDNNTQELIQKLSSMSTTLTKDDCLDLPEKIYQTWNTELTTEQRRVYNELVSDAMTEVNGDIASVQLALTMLLRLHQIVCGYLPMDSGKIEDLPCKRLDDLLNAVEAYDEQKVVIFASYRRDIERIRARLCEVYGPGAAVDYYGATSLEDRVRNIALFQDGADGQSPRFFVGNPQVAGRGITLTRSSLCIFYSNGFDLELRKQAEDRLHRIGQRNVVRYVDMRAVGTIDDKIIKALIKKWNIASQFTGEHLKQWISLSSDL